MALTVYDLSSEVFLYLVSFQRRAEDGEPLAYADVRAEVLALLNDLDQRSHLETGLRENWLKVRVPLIYLIDEVMILNAEWPHRDTWANECLEVTLLGHPEALGGERFYTNCDEAIKELETAERLNRQDAGTKADVLSVYYVALQLGFKGKYALDLDAWREYKLHVFSKLPAYAQTRTKELTPEADDHTIQLDPNYEPVTRLLYVGLAFAVIVALYLGASWGYWSEMVGELAAYAREHGVPTSQPA